MTLPEADQILSQVDCGDPELVAAALTERARAIAEFASTASREQLNETLAAGDAFRNRIVTAQIEALLELDRITKLSRGLESTLNQHQTGQITCFG